MARVRQAGSRRLEGIFPAGALLALLLLFPASRGTAATAAASAEERPPAYDILKEADRARGNLEGVVWDVELVTKEQGERDSSRAFFVQAKGYDFVATTTRPRKEKGQLVLMVKHNMWFYKPDLPKPVPISQRQKLMGQAAYGDIAATNYAEDYYASALPDETFHGEGCFVFDLTAKTKRATYNRIVYWISKARNVGVKADYYTVSNRLFKSALMQYDNTTLGEGGKGRNSISRMVITSALTSGEETHLIFSDMTLKVLPDSVFNVNLLRK